MGLISQLYFFWYYSDNSFAFAYQLPPATVFMANFRMFKSIYSSWDNYTLISAKSSTAKSSPTVFTSEQLRKPHVGIYMG